MKRLLLLLLFFSILLSSCATYKLNKSVWYNLSFVENDGQKVDMTTSLHFISENQVDVFVSVVSDSIFIVKPFKYAEGTYQVNGNPKKQALINMDLKTIDNNKITWTGAYHKDEGMVLQSSDSIVKIYGKIPNVTLP